MIDPSPLDNPIWHALNSLQRPFNIGTALAARYPVEVSRFVALAHPTPEAFSDLASLVQHGDTVALFTAEALSVPTEWTVMRARSLDQMICHRMDGGEARLPLQLGAEDIPEMLALAQATDPGPFSEGTIRMGRYYGLRADDGRLAAMAGERLRLTDYTEVSAVCTDPAFRGRGYASSLVRGLAAQALAEGCTPFLHVKHENGARALYEALGFQVRRTIHLTVLARMGR